MNEYHSIIQAYPHQTFDKVRYADTDRQGHVNNASFAQYLETGRVEILYLGLEDKKPEHTNFVIANLTIQYVGEIHWPGLIQIGTQIERIGKSSITFEQTLVQEERLVATAQTVIVQVDPTTKKSYPLSEDSISFLQAFLKRN